MPAETSIQLTRMTTPTKGTTTSIKPNGNNSLLFSKGLSEENHKSPNSRLLHLAERSTNPRKSGASSSPSHLLSFRNVISPTKASTPIPPSSAFARRNTSIINSSSPNSSPVEKSARQNPKLYTSFSAKSCSKLTKAFIRSDPLKTNIEHLVSPTHKPALTKSPSHSPNSSTHNDVSHSSSPSRYVIGPSSGANTNYPSDNCGDHGRGSISNLISTPLKALHASFHDRSKLSSAFAPRSRLFSQRDKPTQNQNHTQKSPKEKSSKTFISNRDNSPDFLEYFGNPHTTQRLSQQAPLSPSNDTPRNYSTPDILEDVLGFDNESNYIILERGRRASEDFINRSNNISQAVLRGKIHSSTPEHKTTQSHHKSPIPIKSGTHSSKQNQHNDVQISSRNLTRDQNHQNPNQVAGGNLHTNNNYKQQQQHSHKNKTEESSPPLPSDTEGEGIVMLPNNAMKMSTATPMKISSSSASRAQIITLMARSTPNDEFDNGTTMPKTHEQSANNLTKKTTAGVSHLNSKDLLHLHNNKKAYNHQVQTTSSQLQPQQNPSGVIAKFPESGSRNSSWINSNYATTTNVHDLVFDECDQHVDVPPPIPKRCSTTNMLVSPKSKPPPPPTPIVTSVTQSEIKSVTAPLKSFGCTVDVDNDTTKYKSNDSNLRTGLLVASVGGHAHLLEHNNKQQSMIVSNYSHHQGGDDVSETETVDLIHDEYNENVDKDYKMGNFNLKSFERAPINVNVDNEDNVCGGRKLSFSSKSTRPRNNNKVRPEKRFNLMHSFSFRSDGKSKSGNGCGGYSPLENEDIQHLNRSRSRSLPKSFMSGKMKGPQSLRSVLPSLWIRDEPSFERLSEENRSPESASTSSSPSYEDSDLAKMRWQKLAASSNSSSMTEGHGRPKSFDYSQRKAWMKYYRDMEISSATSGDPIATASVSSSSSTSRPSKGISKGSISHLHLQPSSSSSSKEELVGVVAGCTVHGHPNPPEMGIARRTPDSLGVTPSLFQRFSKTFSLRFGSSSNLSKVNEACNIAQVQGKKSGNKGSSMGIGSSPDLHSRFDGDVHSGKMRKGKSKSIRGEKCQSGDSGIGIDESHSTSRLRRIRSEFIETSSHLFPESHSSGGAPNRNSTSVLLNGGTSSSSSAMGKMSLVEIPDHIWEEEKARQQRKSVGGLTASYEDVLESKLDGDDGFSSGDDSGSRTGKLSDNGEPSSSSDDPVLGRQENPAYHHYHSLPHKNSRKAHKQGLPNGGGHPVNLTPSGRSKSLEDEQEQQNKGVEDNSIRGKVIREIILTEQNYVKTLNDIVQGFVNPCRARTDLFSGESIRNIFSNIEDILRLHARFLDAMKERIHPTSISTSNVGQIFTEWADHFNLYSEYCCNNPISMATVRSLMQNQEYAQFFEACRRLQLMDKLPLHGFLLRPIQRICQYHLQLAELLKQTEASHTDYPTVVEAVETMKSVAMKINDTQRQFDSLQEIIRLQNSIDGWEGSDLLNRNSIVLTKGELTKTTQGKRNNKEVFCFLLNKDLVFCKKDFIKKGGYVFDGRIDLEVGVWLNIDSNEEDEYFGMVHNSWRIYSPGQKHWILFTAPTPTDKRRWITSLEKTLEIQGADPRMCTMAKLTTLLSEDRPQSHHNYSSSSNTLPKSSKKSKGKHSSVTTNNGKIDADAMLIEVSKLKRHTYIGAQQQQPTLQKDRGSKFYV